jgi:hypothetical protein
MVGIGGPCGVRSTIGVAEPVTAEIAASEAMKMK